LNCEYQEAQQLIESVVHGFKHATLGRDDLMQVGWAEYLRASQRWEKENHEPAPDPYLRQCVRNGVLKSINEENQRRLIGAAALDGVPEPETDDPGLSRAQLADLLAPLGELEQLVAGHLSRGESQRECAAALGLSRDTVRSVIRNLKHKLKGAKING
jgi:DNA-directed RNA polymerase specialized sigma24 family protein